MLGLLIYSARVAWSFALGRPVVACSLPLVLEGRQAALSRFFDCIGKARLAHCGLDRVPRRGRLVLALDPSSDPQALYQKRRTELMAAVDRLEEDFAERGRYPTDFTFPAGRYTTDGDDFALHCAGTDFSLAYDSRTGLQQRPPARAVPQAALLRQRTTRWGPWKRRQVQLIALTATPATMRRLRCRAVEGSAALASPVRVLALPVALPAVARARLPRYTHFEIDFNPYSRSIRARAYHSRPDRPWETARLPAVAAGSAFWMVGDGRFLKRLGLPCAGTGVVRLATDHRLDAAALHRFATMLLGGRFGIGAPGTVPLRQALSLLGGLPGKPVAAGSLVWVDGAGRDWRWTWAAGRGAQADWLVARAVPSHPRTTAEVPVGHPAVEAAYHERVTVPAARSACKGGDRPSMLRPATTNASASRRG